jgi:pimeloyl-ACP methyl ester carboxylesterase
LCAGGLLPNDRLGTKSSGGNLGEGEDPMPTVQANGIDVYYEVQGEGEPMVFIPYLAADQACYAFQVADYAKQFTCFTVDLRGAGLSGKPEGTHTSELLADDVAAFMQAAGVGRAHVFGLSLGAEVAIWLAARNPGLVKSLSLHSAWDATDPFLRVVVESWRIMARGLGDVTDAVIAGIFPYCFTPETYAARSEYIDSLADFVRGRPMPQVDAFLRQSEAVLSNDVRPALPAIQAPTLISFGGRDTCTSTRFAGPLSKGIAGSEVTVFDNCAHAPIYEDVEEFNARTLAFLNRHTG